MPFLDSFVKETARLSPGPIRKQAAIPCQRKNRKGKIWCSLLMQSHLTKSALLAPSWSHIPSLMAITSRLAIGSPYHNSRSCAMRASGRAPWRSRGFASWTKRRERQSLDSLIRVTSSHSGGRLGMLGMLIPLLLLEPCHKTLPAYAPISAEPLAHTLLFSSTYWQTHFTNT